MTRIVTSTYRYKRPPRKRKTVTPGGPAIVTTRTPPVDHPVDAPEPTAPPPANDDSLTEPAPRPSARRPCDRHHHKLEAGDGAGR
jgi:hypothetical protein